MSNIPEFINKISELKQKKNELINQVNSIDTEINAIVLEWQKVCTHPEEYIHDGVCSACGLTVEGV